MPRWAKSSELPWNYSTQKYSNSLGDKSWQATNSVYSGVYVYLNNMTHTGASYFFAGITEIAVFDPLVAC